MPQPHIQTQQISTMPANVNVSTSAVPAQVHQQTVNKKKKKLLLKFVKKFLTDFDESIFYSQIE